MNLPALLPSLAFALCAHHANQAQIWLALVTRIGDQASRGAGVDDPVAAVGRRGRVAVEEELADIFVYLVRIADRLDIDLLAVTNRKISSNETKYPVEKVRGSSKKYTEYQ